MIKGEEENQEQPRKKFAKQKIKLAEAENKSLETETEIPNESTGEESRIHSERKDKSEGSFGQEQLLLDF